MSESHNSNKNRAVRVLAHKQVAQLFNVSLNTVANYRTRTDRALYGTCTWAGLKPRWHYDLAEVEAFAAYHGLALNWAALEEA